MEWNTLIIQLQHCPYALFMDTVTVSDVQHICAYTRTISIMIKDTGLFQFLYEYMLVYDDCVRQFRLSKKQFRPVTRNNLGLYTNLISCYLS